MVKATVKVKQLLDNLEILGRTFPEAARQIAIESAGSAVAKGKSGIIPRRTGNLSSTARVEVEVDSVKFVTGGLPGAATGADVNYAFFVNNGTSKQSPQFFMERSVSAAATDTSSFAVKALNSWLNQVSGKTNP